jgi:hypothetical protein
MREHRGALTAANLAPGGDARVDRCSVLTTLSAPRTQRDFHLDSAFESNRTGPTDAGEAIEPITAGVHKKDCLGVDCAA